jgi:hypothetical protein
LCVDLMLPVLLQLLHWKSFLLHKHMRHQNACSCNYFRMENEGTICLEGVIEKLVGKFFNLAPFLALKGISGKLSYVRIGQFEVAVKADIAKDAHLLRADPLFVHFSELGFHLHSGLYLTNSAISGFFD